MLPEHVSLLRLPGRPSLHREEGWAAVAISHADLEVDAYRSRIWRFPLDGTPALALTAGPQDREPVVSPDGRWIAFLRGDDAGRAQLAVVDTRGGEPRVLTGHSLGVSGRPSWSPDGARLAYVARVPEQGRFGTAAGVGPEAEPPRRITRPDYRSDGTGFTIGRPAHVHVVDVPLPELPVDGAPTAPRPLRLTIGEVDHADPIWTPDGASLLVRRGRVGAVGDDLVRLDLPILSGEDPALRATGERSEPGSSPGGEVSVALVPLPARVVEVPAGRFSVVAAAFVPHPDRGPMDVGALDGTPDDVEVDLPDDPDDDPSDLAPLSDTPGAHPPSDEIPAAVPEPDSDAWAHDVGERDFAALGGARRLPPTAPVPHGVQGIETSDEGETLLLLLVELGADGGYSVGSNAALVRGVLEGAAVRSFVRLTDPSLDDLAAGTGDAGTGSFEVREKGAGGLDVLLRRVRRGQTELVRVNVPTATSDPAVGRAPITALFSGGSVTGAVSSRDGQAVVSAVLPDSPGELLLVAPATLDSDVPDGVARLTELAAPLRAATAISTPTPVPGARAGDGYTVHGWTLLPDSAAHGPGPYPVLLMIHGGPYAAYEDAFLDEAQVATGAGYAVVLGNPRGSAGYGSAHGRAIVGRMGTLDAVDVLALLDAALAADARLDASRVGVMGGSYGGYLTAWLTTTAAASRFRAAIVERGFLDPVSFVGSSDIGWYFTDSYVGTDPGQIAAQSPMAHIGRVSTPTLVIHSEQDWRCPLEQGQRWFTGLRRAGVETELLLFPGEGHELSRSGRPSHRVARFRAVLDWWERHLK